MISCIICHKKKEHLSRIQQNIQLTIGVEYELIIVDNTNNERSIAEAYNYGASQAKFHFLCFLHEDIDFISYDWGNKAIRHIQEGNLLIGVAGSKYKSNIVSGWTTTQLQLDQINIYQLKNGLCEKSFQQNGESITSKVVCLDGVWLFTTKLIWNEFKFNSNLLKGFHFYDIDFSLRCAKKGNIAVVFDIDIIHFSKGNFDSRWIKDAFKFHEFYKKELPFFTQDIFIDITEIEQKVFRSWLKILRNSVTKTQLLKFIMQEFRFDKRQALYHVKRIFFK